MDFYSMERFEIMGDAMEELEDELLFEADMEYFAEHPEEAPWYMTDEQIDEMLWELDRMARG